MKNNALCGVLHLIRHSAALRATFPSRGRLKRYPCVAKRADLMVPFTQGRLFVAPQAHIIGEATSLCLWHNIISPQVPYSLPGRNSRKSELFGGSEAGRGGKWVSAARTAAV